MKNELSRWCDGSFFVIDFVVVLERKVNGVNWCCVSIHEFL